MITAAAILAAVLIPALAIALGRPRRPVDQRRTGPHLVNGLDWTPIVERECDR